MEDLFSNSRLPDGGQPYPEERINRKPMMKDRGFYLPALQMIYEGGARGLPMPVLAREGITKEWWQDTVDKHFGEKMRMLWAFGVLTSNDYPGTSGIQHVRLIFPSFARIQYMSSWAQENHDRLMPLITRLDFVDQKDRV